MRRVGLTVPVLALILTAATLSAADSRETRLRAERLRGAGPGEPGAGPAAPAPVAAAEAAAAAGPSGPGAVSEPGPRPGPAAGGAPSPAPATRSPEAWGAALRLAGATAAVGLLLLAVLSGGRRLLRGPVRGAHALRARSRARGRPGWLARFIPAPPPEGDAVHVVGRSYVGSRESVCVIRVGRERFLVGVTGTQVSLLSRLEATPAAVAPEGDPDRLAAIEPPVQSFARELEGLAALRPETRDGELAATVADSRARLARLARALAGGRGGRG
jgi:hypothetical protein